MNCIKCAREIPPDSKFCPYCGKPQVPAKKHRKRPNGAGSIVKLSGNRSKPWAAKKAGVLVGTFSTRGEAAKALERITDATINDRYNWTFTQVYEAWKPGHDLTVGDDGKKSTVTAYNACTELHDLKFRSLRKSDFQTVLDRLTVEGKSKSTCEKMLQLFGAMSEWAIFNWIANIAPITPIIPACIMLICSHLFLFYFHFLFSFPALSFTIMRIIV